MAGTNSPGPVGSGTLRYPLGTLEKTADYLFIGIRDYTAGGSVELGALEESGVSGTPTFGNKPLNQNQKNNIIQNQIKNGDLTQNYTVSSAGGFKFARRNKFKTQTANIILPIPSNIQDGNSVKYTEGSLDGLTAQTLAVAIGAMSQNPNVDIATVIQNTLKNMTNTALDPATRDYFLRTLAVGAANIPFGGNLTASQLLARTQGNILNPNMELLFDGVTLRSFKFSFKMTPRNKDEAKQIKLIIRELKKSMAPGQGSTGFQGKTSQIPNLYLKTPKIFELKYMKGNEPHPFLHKFKQCFLTDMSVNYTGEGTYTTYGGSNAEGGGTPVSMIMDLGFKELEPIYAGDYKEQGANDYDEDLHGGVGY